MAQRQNQWGFRKIENTRGIRRIVCGIWGNPGRFTIFISALWDPFPAGNPIFGCFPQREPRKRGIAPLFLLAPIPTKELAPGGRGVFQKNFAAKDPQGFRRNWGPIGSLGPMKKLWWKVCGAGKSIAFEPDCGAPGWPGVGVAFKGTKITMGRGGPVFSWLEFIWASPRPGKAGVRGFHRPGGPKLPPTGSHPPRGDPTGGPRKNIPRIPHPGPRPAIPRDCWFWDPPV